MCKYTVFKLLIAASLIHLWVPTDVAAHERHWATEHVLDWNSNAIHKVTFFAPFSTVEPDMRMIEGRKCMTGPFLNVDVDDTYAFDIDETVFVDIEFALQDTPTDVALVYDRNSGMPANVTAHLPDSSNGLFYRHRFELKRARFANRPILLQLHSGDFAVGVNRGGYIDPIKSVTVCDIKIIRNDELRSSSRAGRLTIEVVDENGFLTPARIGLYNDTGRMPLPSSDALSIDYYSLKSRSLPIGTLLKWPVENRFAFVINGDYRAELPPGKYDLVAMRGLEYEAVREHFEIRPNEETRLKIKLSRWADMPAQNWYSGDVHIHYGRSDVSDDKKILTLARAEDLNIANLLQMGDIALLDFTQYNWGKDARVQADSYVLVPGQEDPRSNRGHTLQLNIQRPIRNSSRYYQYHELFNAVHEQGGITGYAHVRENYPFGAQLGLALDVPWNLVDFIEVLQFGEISLNTWFDWLNLGYRLPPAAGSDSAPLVPGLPGDVRSYVKLRGKFSVHNWFDGLKSGRTFITTGPMLSMSVNGIELGSNVPDVYVETGEAINVRAKAALNPDIGELERMELYWQGDVVTQVKFNEGAETLNLTFNGQAEQGGWFVVKALGKEDAEGNRVVAVSAPIYVNVNGAGSCKIEAIPELISRQKQFLQELKVTTLESESGYDFPEAVISRKKYWKENRELLLPRIKATDKKYDNILSLALEGKCFQN